MSDTTNDRGGCAFTLLVVLVICLLSTCNKLDSIEKKIDGLYQNTKTQQTEAQGK